MTSDVDIALFGEQLTLTDLARLSAALGEIPMAQSADLVLYESVRDRTLLEHIRNDGVEWFKREHVAVRGLRERRTSAALPSRTLSTSLSAALTRDPSQASDPSAFCNYMDVYNNTFITHELDFMEATATDREMARCGLARGDVIITKDSESTTTSASLPS